MIVILSFLRNELTVDKSPYRHLEMLDLLTK